MQLNKLGAVTGLLLTALLGACGGGDDEAPPAPAARTVIVSPIKLSSATPAYAEAELQFEGGACSSGTDTLVATWDFGDSKGTGAYAPHIYDTEGNKTITVTCTDSSGSTKVATLTLNVASAAMAGFLGKSWTPYANIESNPLPYPVAGLTSDGDIYGVWIRSAVGAPNEVATGTTNFSSTNWTVSNAALAPETDRSPFNVTQAGIRTAAIDLAVSPNGHAITAWMAGAKIWYATKDNLASAWSTPHFIDVPVLDKSIKVAINDAGKGAIAYCTGAGAQLIRDLVSPASDLASPTSVTISSQCDEMSTSQRMRSFDIAIDSATVYAVGIAPATNPAQSVVTLHSCTIGGGCATPKAISAALTDAPKSLSFSRSPKGTYAAIAWNQNDVVNAQPVSNVYASIYAPGTPTATWGSPTPVHITIPTNDYSRPLVAINESGDAFLAMQLLTNGGYTYATVVTNYQAATKSAWHAPFQVASSGLSATDIAIDRWGTGLLTRVDLTGGKSQVGTFPKTGGWGTLTLRNLTHPSYRANTFHYQTMRALPDGRAILATSVYDTTVTSKEASPVFSGYMLLQ